MRSILPGSPLEDMFQTQVLPIRSFTDSSEETRSRFAAVQNVRASRWYKGRHAKGGTS